MCLLRGKELNLLNIIHATFRLTLLKGRVSQARDKVQNEDTVNQPVVLTCGSGDSRYS